MPGHSKRAEEMDSSAPAVPSNASTLEAGTSDTLPGSKIDELLERIAHPTLPAPVHPPYLGLELGAPSLRTARIERILEDGHVELRFRGNTISPLAQIDEGVQVELLQAAMEQGQPVLVEVSAGHPPVVVGIIQTRLPERVELKAKEVVIDAEKEVLIRAGNAALRMRSDGEIEMVGSRILTISRGLFRIVGKMLRLN